MSIYKTIIKSLLILHFSLLFCNVAFSATLKKIKTKNSFLPNTTLNSLKKTNYIKNNPTLNKGIDAEAKKKSQSPNEEKDLHEGIIVQTKIMPPEGRLIGNIILESRSQFDLRDIENKYLRQICSILKCLTPSIDTKTILSRLDFSEESASIIKISNFLPNIDIKDQRSQKGTFTNNRLDIQKLKFAKKQLDKLRYIVKVIITLQDNPIDNTYVDIKVSFKNLFPIMVNPFNYSIKCINFFGTGHIIAFKAFPKYIFLDGYEINYLAPNIYNTNINCSLLYKDSRYIKTTKIELTRPFLRFTRLGGGAFKASTYKKIGVLGLPKKSYDFKYNKSSLWFGKTVDIWDYSYDEYYKRLIFTIGLSNCYYTEAPLNLKKYGIPIMNNKDIKGMGICLLKKSYFSIQDIRGRAKEYLWKGYKIYIYGGYISEDFIKRRKYIALNLGSGLYSTNFGYLYLNTKLYNVTNGISRVFIGKIATNNIPAIRCMKGSVGYISTKYSISNIKLRQIIGLKYTAFFGGEFKPLSKIDGFFNYITQYVYADLKYKIALGIETILYNPIKLYVINIDPFFYIENLFFKVRKYQKKLVSKNFFSVGGGLLLSAFGFTFQIGSGIIKDGSGNTDFTFTTILQAPILTTSTDISVDSPSNVSFQD